MALLVAAPRSVDAYSVLAHEAAIDGMWDVGICPLLLRRFPTSSPDTLNRARSYAYGGSVIQDLGYYPFGNKLFSNLLHYVRSGDFIEALIRDAQTIDEYAFALGALAHYALDNTGHPEATNRAVPLIFPKLQRKFGDTVTYAQAAKEHVIAEFSFDVVQSAGGRYLPEAYRGFIGFSVASRVLDRAFLETYGLEMKDLFEDTKRALGTYRYAVSQIVPALTVAAWRDKHDEIMQSKPGVEQSSFIFRYPPLDYERDYGREYQKPALLARFLAFLYRIVPKVGPLKPLSFKSPQPQVESMFSLGFHHAAERYRSALEDIANGRFDLRNTDFDTGRPARHGEYALADTTYAELLAALDSRSFKAVPEALQKDILKFYGPQASPLPGNKRERKLWKHVQRALGGFSPADQSRP